MAELTYTKKIQLDDSFDVIVVGGGPSGCTAAASASREGAKTLLIEATGALGGMGTTGLVPAWCPFSDKEKIIYKGMAEKIFNASKKEVNHVRDTDTDWVPIDSEVLKRIYDDFVIEYGVKVLFNTVLSDVITNENNEVTEIIVSNKGGLTAYSAKVFVDCTGDADLAVWAGAKYEKGDENSDLMPATHCFVLTNVDQYALEYDKRSGRNYGGLHPNNKNSIVYDIAKDERYPLITDNHLCYNIIGPGTVGFNAGHLWNVDNSDPYNITDSLILGRKIANEFKKALAEYYPSAFSNAFLVSTAQLMGIREGRRIIGDYVLTVEDYLARRTFPDEICRNSYYLDVHLSEAEAKKALNNGIDLETYKLRYQKGESHGIPYRSLLPKDLTNVIVAGRSISCDRRIQGSVRVMPTCLCMGEAAGMAAAHASSNDSNNVHEIDVEKLRQRLREEGVYIL